MTMIKKRLILPAITLLSSCAVSCVMAGEKNQYFEYVKERVTTPNGEIYIGATPTPKLVNINGEQVESWEGPYRFNVQYNPVGDATVLFGYLTDIRVLSVETGKVVFSADRIGDVDTEDAHEHQDIQKGLLGFGAVLPDFPYADLAVSMGFVMYSDRDEVMDEGTISVVIYRDFYKARRRKGVGIL